MKGKLIKWHIILIFGVGMLFLTGSASAKVLNVPERSQEHSEWCWAGSAKATLDYYSTSVTQCAIANWAWSRSDCCGNTDFYWNHTCNQSNYMFGSGGSLQNILIHWGVNNNAIYTYLSQPTVTSEINADRPFVMRFGWTSGGGHFLVGRGIEGNNLYYMDPWPGNGYTISPYSWVVSAADHDWTHTLQITTNPGPGTSTYRVLAGGDYNGDDYADIAIFRPSTGLWSVRGITRVYFGGSSDIPVPGDYDGDGVTDIGIFRPSSGLWAIRGFQRYYFGSSSDTPIPGDYSGNGSCNIAIFRPSTGLWSVMGLTRSYFGGSSDKPVPGDYSGNGTTDICIFRESSGLWAGPSIGRAYFGAAGDIPVPGDYNGYYPGSDPEDWGAAIFRPSTGLWSIKGYTRYYFGSSSDQPVPADYNEFYGDDIAIFRENTGLWSIRGYTRTYYGSSGDIPVTR